MMLQEAGSLMGGGGGMGSVALSTPPSPTLPSDREYKDCTDYAKDSSPFLPSRDRPLPHRLRLHPHAYPHHPSHLTSSPLMPFPSLERDREREASMTVQDLPPPETLPPTHSLTRPLSHTLHHRPALSHPHPLPPNPTLSLPPPPSLSHCLSPLPPPSDYPPAYRTDLPLASRPPMDPPRDPKPYPDKYCTDAPLRVRTLRDPKPYLKDYLPPPSDPPLAVRTAKDPKDLKPSSVDPYSCTDAGGSGRLERSSVRILLADRDSQARQHVLDLLRTCSYQVTPVENARQALEVLRSGGPPVDLILAEVELPNGKGYKMLKHIMKEERLKEIPVVMMSPRDEMAVVVKCLRLGAADYLVKPLRTNELLNLWTHMWRRRRAVGFSERHRMNGLNMNDPPVDGLLQDPSESNTNSTDLFSDDTDEKKKTEPSTSILEVGSGDDGKDDVPRSPVLELSLKLSADASHLRASVDVERKGWEEWRTSPEKPDKRQDKCSPPLKHNELRIGHSSAFINFSDANQRRDIRQPASIGLRLGKDDNLQNLGPAVLCSSPKQHNGSPLRIVMREQDANSKRLSSPLQNSHRSHHNDRMNDHLSLSTTSTEEQLSLATTPGDYVLRHWEGPSSNSSASRGGHQTSSGLTNLTNPVSDSLNRDSFGRENSREGYIRAVYASEGNNARESYRGGDLYGRDNVNRESLPRDVYVREGGMAQDGGACEAFSPRDMSHEPAFSDGSRESFPREGYGREVFGRTSPRWNSRGLPVEPVRSSFPPNHQFTLMKLCIPPDAHPEMGAMLPPSIPHHMPHPHIPSSVSHLPAGLQPIPGLPPSLLPGTIVQSAIPPMYHPHVMSTESPIGMPPPGIVPHPLSAGHGHPTGHFPFYSTPLGRGPSHLPPPHMLAPPAPPWPTMQVPVSERKLELAERREAALNKFRQKRKDRCFEKKIRYVSRKRLAEQRPRNRGQFVKQNNRGTKEGDDEDEYDDDEEYEEEIEGQNNEELSSPDEEENSSGQGLR